MYEKITIYFFIVFKLTGSIQALKFRSLYSLIHRPDTKFPKSGIWLAADENYRLNIIKSYIVDFKKYTSEYMVFFIKMKIWDQTDYKIFDELIDFFDKVFLQFNVNWIHLSLSSSRKTPDIFVYNPLQKKTPTLVNLFSMCTHAWWFKQFAKVFQLSF